MQKQSAWDICINKAGRQACCREKQFGHPPRIISMWVAATNGDFPFTAQRTDFNTRSKKEEKRGEFLLECCEWNSLKHEVRILPVTCLQAIEQQASGNCDNDAHKP